MVVSILHGHCYRLQTVRHGHPKQAFVLIRQCSDGRPDLQRSHTQAEVLRTAVAHGNVPVLLKSQSEKEGKPCSDWATCAV